MRPADTTQPAPTGVCDLTAAAYPRRSRPARDQVLHQDIVCTAESLCPPGGAFMGFSPYGAQCNLRVVVGGGAAAEMDPDLLEAEAQTLVDTLEALGLPSTSRLGVRTLSVPANCFFAMPQHGPHGGVGTVGDAETKVSRRLFFLCRPTGQVLCAQDDSAVDPSKHVRACIGPSVQWTPDEVDLTSLARGIAITLCMQALQQNAPAGQGEGGSARAAKRKR